MNNIICMQTKRPINKFRAKILAEHHERVKGSCYEIEHRGVLNKIGVTDIEAINNQLAPIDTLTGRQLYAIISDWQKLREEEEHTHWVAGYNDGKSGEPVRQTNQMYRDGYERGLKDYDDNN